MTQSENWPQQCPSVAVVSLKTCQLWRRKYWISAFPPFSHSKIFLQLLIFHFIPSSAFLGFWKALEQDAMSSSVSIVRRRKFLNTCEVWFSCIIISYVSIGNSMICSAIWHKYHEWYFKIVIRNFTSHRRVKFETILKYHKWYLR